MSDFSFNNLISQPSFNNTQFLQDADTKQYGEVGDFSSFLDKAKNNLVELPGTLESIKNKINLSLPIASSEYSRISLELFEYSSQYSDSPGESGISKEEFQTATLTMATFFQEYGCMDCADHLAQEWASLDKNSEGFAYVQELLVSISRKTTYEFKGLRNTMSAFNSAPEDFGDLTRSLKERLRLNIERIMKSPGFDKQEDAQDILSGLGYSKSNYDVDQAQLLNLFLTSTSSDDDDEDSSSGFSFPGLESF